MRMQFVSNIKLHLCKKMPNIKELIVPKAPILILGGNICFVKHPFFLPFFQKLSKMFEHIIYVFGPHEYYHIGDLQMESPAALETYAKDLLVDIKNVHILQKEDFKIDNIVFLGCTLWSYISKRDLVIKTYPLVQNSFVRCGTKILMNPLITNKIHFEHKLWLERMADTFAEEIKVVVTFFLPSFCSLDDKFSFLSKASYSNCDELAARMSAWCAGKGKVQKIVDIARTPLYINPHSAEQDNELLFFV